MNEMVIEPASFADQHPSPRASQVEDDPEGTSITHLSTVSWLRPVAISWTYCVLYVCHYVLVLSCLLCGLFSHI